MKTGLWDACKNIINYQGFSYYFDLIMDHNIGSSSYQRSAILSPPTSI